MNNSNEYAWLAFVTTAVNQYIDDHVKYADLDPLDRQAWLALSETQKARLRIMQPWCQTTYLTQGCLENSGLFISHLASLAKYAVAFFRMSRSSVTRVRSRFRRRISASLSSPPDGCENFLFHA
jgi:hypothetical protein